MKKTVSMITFLSILCFLIAPLSSFAQTNDAAEKVLKNEKREKVIKELKEKLKNSSTADDVPFEVINEAFNENGEKVNGDVKVVKVKTGSYNKSNSNKMSASNNKNENVEQYAGLVTASIMSDSGTNGYQGNLYQTHYLEWDEAYDDGDTFVKLRYMSSSWERDSIYYEVRNVVQYATSSGRSLSSDTSCEETWNIGTPSFSGDSTNTYSNYIEGGNCPYIQSDGSASSDNIGSNGRSDVYIYGGKTYDNWTTAINF